MAVFSDNALAFHTSSAAKLLTTSYVAGDVIKADASSEVWLSLVLSATAVTSVDWYIEWSFNGTTYHRIPAVNSITAGSVDYDPAVMVGPAGSCSYGPIAVPAGSTIRMSAKRTGGDATSALLARAHFVAV